jgi:hypothetical protein
VAGGDLVLAGLGGEEGDGLADEVDALASLAHESNLELPVVETDGFDCMG